MDKTGIVLGAITVVAIVVGPIAALWIQRLLDESRDVRKRKMWIFKTLMSNRATRMAPVYVQALNLIDVEFISDNEKEKAVRNAWKELADLYLNWKNTANALEKADELNAVLLSEMGKVLGYDFDKVYLRKGAYYPEYLQNAELEQHALRRALLELLNGQRRVPVGVFEERFPEIKVPKVDIEQFAGVAEPKKLSG
jgi:hypothetical protein